MSITTSTSGDKIIFAVHDVSVATDKLETIKTREAIVDLIATNERRPEPVRSYSGYNSSVVKGVLFHPLLAGVHLAFSQHRPLVLSPDMLWIAILQGLSQHVRNNADSLRSKLVNIQEQ